MRQGQQKKPTDSSDSVNSSTAAETQSPQPLVVWEKAVGAFGALCLVKYDDEIPQIAKIVLLTELAATIEWWNGGWTATWTQWKTKGVPNTETVSRNAIVMIPIKLTSSNRLSKCTVEKLKGLYDEIELI